MYKLSPYKIADLLLDNNKIYEYRKEYIRILNDILFNRDTDSPEVDTKLLILSLSRTIKDIDDGSSSIRE